MVQRSASSPLLNRYSVQFERRQVSKLLTKLTQIGDVPYCTESGGGGGDGRPFVGRRADSKKTHRSCRQVKPMELWVHECLCLPLDAADKVTRDPLCLFTSIADSRRKEFISCSVP